MGCRVLKQKTTKSVVTFCIGSLEAYLHYVGPHDLSSPRILPAFLASRTLSPATEELVPDLLLAELEIHVKSLHVSGVEISDLGHIFLFHLTETVSIQQTGSFRDFVDADHASECHIRGDVREADIHKFGDVETTVIVSDDCMSVKTPDDMYYCKLTDTLIRVWAAGPRRCKALGTPP